MHCNDILLRIPREMARAERGQCPGSARQAFERTTGLHIVLLKRKKPHISVVQVQSGIDSRESPCMCVSAVCHQRESTVFDKYGISRISSYSSFPDCQKVIGMPWVFFELGKATSPIVDAMGGIARFNGLHNDVPFGMINKRSAAAVVQRVRDEKMQEPRGSVSSRPCSENSCPVSRARGLMAGSACLSDSISDRIFLELLLVADIFVDLGAT